MRDPIWKKPRRRRFAKVHKFRVGVAHPYVLYGYRGVQDAQPSWPHFLLLVPVTERRRFKAGDRMEGSEKFLATVTLLLPVERRRERPCVNSFRDRPTPHLNFNIRHLCRKNLRFWPLSQVYLAIQQMGGNWL